MDSMLGHRIGPQQQGPPKSLYNPSISLWGPEPKFPNLGHPCRAFGALTGPKKAGKIMAQDPSNTGQKRPRSYILLGGPDRR